MHTAKYSALLKNKGKKQKTQLNFNNISFVSFQFHFISFYFVLRLFFQVVIAGSICSRDQVHLFSRCANKFVRITHDGKVLANDMSSTPRKLNSQFHIQFIIFLSLTHTILFNTHITFACDFFAHATHICFWCVVERK